MKERKKKRKEKLLIFKYFNLLKKELDKCKKITLIQF